MYQTNVSLHKYTYYMYWHNVYFGLYLFIHFRLDVSWCTDLSHHKPNVKLIRVNRKLTKKRKKWPISFLRINLWNNLQISLVRTELFKRNTTIHTNRGNKSWAYFQRCFTVSCAIQRVLNDITLVHITVCIHDRSWKYLWITWFIILAVSSEPDCINLLMW